MWEIKQWKQLTHITLKDGRILVSEKTPEEIYDWIGNNSHILVDWELHSKFDIIWARKIVVDWIENYILSQSKDIQIMLRQKQKDQPISSQRMEYMEYQVKLFYERNK